jgi:hypothetical protein
MLRSEPLLHGTLCCCVIIFIIIITFIVVLVVVVVVVIIIIIIITIITTIIIIIIIIIIPSPSSSSSHPRGVWAGTMLTDLDSRFSSVVMDARRDHAAGGHRTGLPNHHHRYHHHHNHHHHHPPITINIIISPTRRVGRHHVDGPRLALLLHDARRDHAAGGHRTRLPERPGLPREGYAT